MSIGSQLKAAREDRRLTISEVAAATRSKAQIVEALERDDFSVFAAPIYVKGFIKLIAEYLGQDPRPLVEAYARGLEGAEPPPPSAATGGEEPMPPVRSTPGPDAAPPAAARGRRATEEADLFNDVETPVPEPRRERAAATARNIKLGEKTAAARALGREVVTRWCHALVGAWQRAVAQLGGLRNERDPGKLIPIGIGVVIVLVFVISGLSRCARLPPRDTASTTTESSDMLMAEEAPAPYFD